MSCISITHSLATCSFFLRVLVPLCLLNATRLHRSSFAERALFFSDFDILPAVSEISVILICAREYMFFCFLFCFPLSAS